MLQPMLRIISFSLLSSSLVPALQQQASMGAPGNGGLAADMRLPGSAVTAASRSGGIAAPPSASTVTLFYNHPQTQPTSYVLLIREDGTGHFHSEPLKTPPPESEGLLPTPQDADIWISQPLRDKIFQVARGHKVKAGNCEDGGPKVAFQGIKRLSYEGPGGPQGCEFNWSRDKQIQTLTEQLQAVAQTLEAGRRLEVAHLHDRLGLDAELEDLTRLVAEGHAAEIGNIAPELRELANDPAVLDRVRRRARALLEPSK